MNERISGTRNGGRRRKSGGRIRNRQARANRTRQTSTDRLYLASFRRKHQSPSVRRV